MYKIVLFITGALAVLLTMVFTGCGRTPLFYPPMDIPTSTPTLSAPVSTYTPAPPVPTSTPIPPTFTFTPVPSMTPTWTLTFSAPVSTYTPAPPTSTYTPFPTNTFTPTSTPTTYPSPVTSATPCQTNVPFGETSLSSAPVSFTLLGTGTIFQSYVVPQASKFLNAYVYFLTASADATIQMGIYSDGGGFPSALLYSVGPQAAYANINWGRGPLGGIPLAPGTYWIALSKISGSVAMSLAAGSTANMTSIPEVMPSTFPVGSANPYPPVMAGQGYMGGNFSTCF